MSLITESFVNPTLFHLLNLLSKHFCEIFLQIGLFSCGSEDHMFELCIAASGHDTDS